MKWSSRLLSVRTIGAVLLVVALIITILGFLNQHNGFSLPQPIEYFVADFYANLSTEFISIAMTVLIIDQLYESRRNQQLKEQLIRQMGSSDNGIALNAVEELRAHDWLQDGSLQGVSFYQANLAGAFLPLVNLEQTVFSRADLRNVDLKWANLRSANLNSVFLENSTLIGTDLSKCSLSKANLGGAYLIDAELQEADLREATLIDACLWGANLLNARVTEEQLRNVIMLYDAIMPDGSVYNGRFNLRGDMMLDSEANAVDDVQAFQEQLPGIVRENETHARQYLRWKWVSENFRDN